MTPTQEETLQAELEALKASLPEVARKARDEALEEAESEANRLGREASTEVERSNPDDASGHRDYWLGQATMAGKIRAELRALKSEP